MRWMKLEPIIQSEVSQKDKDQYRIIMHIYGILKDGNDNPICKTEKETQIYRKDFWTLWEKARVECSERTALKQVYYQGWNRSPAQVGCMRQVLRAGTLGRPRGMGWGGRQEGGSGWGTHVNPWLIQISLQLIKINEKRINTTFSMCPQYIKHQYIHSNLILLALWDGFHHTQFRGKEIKRWMTIKKAYAVSQSQTQDLNLRTSSLF